VSDLSDLLAGLAQLFDDEGFGTYNQSGVFTADQTGITIKAVPEKPDNLIVITPTFTIDNAEMNDSTQGVQIRFRGSADPRSVLDRDAAIFDRIHGMHGVVIGGMNVVLVSRQSSLPWPQDQNQRCEHSSNYSVQVARPTRYRTD